MNKNYLNIIHCKCTTFSASAPSFHSAVVTFVGDVPYGRHVCAGRLLQVDNRVQQGGNVLTRFAETVVMTKKINQKYEHPRNFATGETGTAVNIVAKYDMKLLCLAAPL